MQLLWFICVLVVGVGYEVGDEEDLMLDVLSSDESLDGAPCEAYHITCHSIT